MKKYLKDSTNHTNDVTRVLIMAFFILALMYGAYKFGKYFSFQSPVLLRLPFKRVYMYENSRRVEPLPTSVPHKDNGKERQILPSPTPAPTKVLEKPKIQTLNPVQEAIYTYFGNDKVAYAVARAEAGLTCHKVHYNNNGTVDRGLFQINSIHDWRFAKFGGDPFNCYDNAKVAYEIQKEQGWSPWSVYNSGSYLAFIN
jgi:hypothetical protein